MKTSTMLLATGALWLVPVVAAWGQSPERSFYDISLGEVSPWRMKQERGVNPGIAAGSHEGIYIRFAEDIARLCSQRRNVAAADRMRLNVFATEGGFDSLRRLRTEDEVQLAIVQSDLWYYAKRHGLPHDNNMLSEKEKEIRKDWTDIEQNISLLLPLYEEMIHILVKPKDKTDIGDLVGLFQKQKRVNIGTAHSGTRVTCTLLEEILAPHIEGRKKWQTTSYDTDTALTRLLSNDPRESIDAVILVGGVPFPALDRFTLQLVKPSVPGKNLLVDIKELFVDHNPVPQMALLPFGKANEWIDADHEAANVFRGGEDVAIDCSKYAFLDTTEKFPTRAVTACLVTHRKYVESPPPPNEEHKIIWVRHILYEVLRNLTPRTETGLVYGFVPLSDMWRSTAVNLENVNAKTLSRDAFGWQFHPDRKIEEMLRLWGQVLPGGMAFTKPVDPHSHF